MPCLIASDGTKGILSWYHPTSLTSHDGQPRLVTSDLPGASPAAYSNQYAVTGAPGCPYARHLMLRASDASFEGTAQRRHRRGLMSVISAMPPISVHHCPLELLVMAKHVIYTMRVVVNENLKPPIIPCRCTAFWDERGLLPWYHPSSSSTLRVLDLKRFTVNLVARNVCQSVPTTAPYVSQERLGGDVTTKEYDEVPSNTLVLWAQSLCVLSSSQPITSPLYFHHYIRSVGFPSSREIPGNAV